LRLLKVRRMVPKTPGYAAHDQCRKIPNLPELDASCANTKMDELPQTRKRHKRVKSQLVGLRPELRRYVEIFPKRNMK